MKKKHWSAKLSLMLIALVIVLAGCQPVGSVDVSKVMSNLFTVKSSEGASSVTLELTADPAASITPEEKRAIELLNGFKVEVTEMKQQSPTELSAKGSLAYANVKIPFHLVLSDMIYTIQIEGAKKPIVIGNSAAIGAGSALPTTPELQKQIEQLGQKAVEAMPKFSSFFTSNFPNPKTISAEAANVTVNGEALQLQKLHVELKGSELVGLIKGFLTNVLKDEEGLKQFIAALYDVYAPFLKEMVKAGSANAEGDTGALDSIMPFLENKTLAVEFIYTFLKSNLEQVVASFDQSLNSLPKNEDGKSVQDLLNDNQSLTMDLYVDAENVTRKSTSVLLLTLPDSAKHGLKSIKVTSSGEVWNVNKPVTIDPIDTTGGVVEWMNKSGRLTSSKLVASLDPKSDLYKLLKDELNITKKEVNLTVSSEDSINPGLTPFNDQGTVMVPARFVAEQLDADVEWDAAKQQVTITDPLSGNVTVLTINSTQASVNGQLQTLEKAAVIVDGSTYIPVRFVAESMNAKVGWTQETQTVGIVRE
ncbi:copper amine oxidase N-terminal domain-containing protein [Paenibacillus validus]|uniref:copper amine oxidase N-terminal domain-containing protein n=1 Tax=Paenibacillus validus TaxID=44253 RepID=UPI003D265042